MMAAPASRLDPADRGPEETASSPDLIRAVVLLSRVGDAPDAGRRPSRDERRRMAELRRDEARDAIPVIDAVLARCGGRRIGEATTLGTLTIETTAEGIQMLRRTASVQSVIRDQPVTTGHSISRFSLTDSTG